MQESRINGTTSLYYCIIYRQGFTAGRGRCNRGESTPNAISRADQIDIRERRGGANGQSKREPPFQVSSTSHRIESYNFGPLGRLGNGLFVGRSLVVGRSLFVGCSQGGCGRKGETAGNEKRHRKT